MTKRPFDQSGHDRVIQVAADNLRNANKYEVYTNPGSERNTKVGEFYPDIIVTSRGSNTVQFIIEVETSSSINENEITQWRDYSALGGAFYLLVPQADLSKAKQLCSANNIVAKFGSFSANAQGGFDILYE